MKNKPVASFVAHVVRIDDPTDQGILYVRLAHESHKSSWAKISKRRDEVAPDVVMFDSLQLALDDARAISRMGSYCCVTEIDHTPFSEQSVQMIADFLINAGFLKAA